MLRSRQRSKGGPAVKIVFYRREPDPFLPSLGFRIAMWITAVLLLSIAFMSCGARTG
jgi:hypothetical protein